MDTGLILHTFLGLLLLLIPAGALYVLERQMLPKFAVSVARMVVQLLAFCLVVWALILWYLSSELDKYWIGEKPKDYSGKFRGKKVVDDVEYDVEEGRGRPEPDPAQESEPTPEPEPDPEPEPEEHMQAETEEVEQNA